jgi:hypothetical protein
MLGERENREVTGKQDRTTTANSTINHQVNIKVKFWSCCNLYMLNLIQSIWTGRVMEKLKQRAKKMENVKCRNVNMRKCRNLYMCIVWMCRWRVKYCKIWKIDVIYARDENMFTAVILFFHVNGEARRGEWNVVMCVKSTEMRRNIDLQKNNEWPAAYSNVINYI